jgi:DNA polymerase (family 10)
MDADTSYTDEKGRTRWRRNDWLAQKLNELHDLLVISGYDPSHAARYPKLAYAISRMPVSIDALAAQDRLDEIPGIGDTVEKIVRQTLMTGTSDKFDECAATTPLSVLEMRRIPRLGARTIHYLYKELGVDSLSSLKDAEAAGRLNDVPGLGPTLRAAIRKDS